MLKADEEYAHSLSEQTEASSPPPSPSHAPPSPHSDLSLSPCALSPFATGGRFDVLASPRLLPLTPPQAKGHQAPPPIIHSFGAASTSAATPSPSAFNQAQRHFDDASTVAETAHRKIQTNEGLHDEANRGIYQVSRDYAPRIADMEEALARLVAAQLAAESAARARARKYALAIAASREEAKVADANKATARALREEARTETVRAAEAAGTPLLPKAVPPTRPFSSAPPPQAAPHPPSARTKDEDAAACCAFKRREDLRARLPDFTEAQIERFIAADTGGVQRPPFAAAGFPTTMFTMSGVNHASGHQLPPQQEHSRGGRYQSSWPGGRGHDDRRGRGRYDNWSARI